jgi:hypothetical protein
MKLYNLKRFILGREKVIFCLMLLGTILPLIFGVLVYERFDLNDEKREQTVENDSGNKLKYKIDPKALEEMDQYFKEREDFIKKEEIKKFKEIFG